MRINIQSSIFILAIVFIIAILAYSIFRGSSSGAALPSIKSLNPSYPYTRRTTIKHVDFTPVTFQQTQDPAFDYKRTIDELIENENDMYDQQMILIIRNYLIQQPTLKPYSLQNKDMFDYSGGQSATVDNVLRFKEDGFYVECCNSDGEENSNSLFFERVRKWNGLVIVTEPEKMTSLQQKNRKAMTLHSCISVTDKTHKKSVSVNEKQTEIHCFPLYSIMAAIEQTNIDFFSLDVGGKDELSILQALPFSELNINMMAVRFEGEIRHYKSDVQLFLENNGYETVLKLVKDDDAVHHLILKKKASFIKSNLFRMILLVVLIIILSVIIYLYASRYYQKRQSTFS